MTSEEQYDANREHCLRVATTYVHIKGTRSYTYKLAFLREIRANTPCLDCEINYPYYIMEFDHVRGKKRQNVAGMSRSMWSAIVEELGKCDIVCANCHSRRTYLRGQRKRKRVNGGT